MLNSTRERNVVTYGRFRNICDAAGHRILSEDKKGIDLFKLVAWLHAERHRPRERELTTAEKRALRDRVRKSAQRADNQEIGLPAARKNVPRWKKACASFRKFCETYFRDKTDPDSMFSLKWSKDHLEVMKIIEDVVYNSRQLALAMPRGSGKTSLFIAAVLWAILIGRRRFGVVVAATEGKAVDILKRIKRILLSNQKLIEDFSYELHGIVALDGESRKATGQKIDGQKTGIEWLSNRIVLPTCPGSAASGSVITVVGITGAIEGQQHAPMTGSGMIRPDIVLADDPQTRASAKSAIQTEERLTALNAGVAGLGGPKRGLSILLAGTKMRAGDLMERLLDNERSPEWGGRVFQAVRKFPDKETGLPLWEKCYSLKIREGDKAALKFYRANRKAMDKGVDVYWPERFHKEKGEISGIQHFMFLMYKDQAVFWSEYQNDPQSEGSMIYHVVARSEVEKRCIPALEGVAQNSASWIAASIDLHQEILYFTVSAISSDFTVRKIAHGTFPDQRTGVFTQDSPPFPLPHCKSDPERAMYNGLVELVRQLADRRWATDAGKVRRTNLITIDARWSPGVVYRFVKESPYPNFIFPYLGMPMGAKAKPISLYDPVRNKSASGEVGRIMEMCYEDTKQVNDQPTIIKADVNTLKTFLHDRLKVDNDMSGSVSFCRGNERTHPIDHNRFFLDHIFSETPFQDVDIQTSRTKTIWKNVDKKQNHWLDCFCANLAIGELLGAKLGFQTQHDTPRGGRTHRLGFQNVQ